VSINELALYSSFTKLKNTRMSVTDIKAHIHELVDRSTDEQLLKDVEQLLNQPAEPDFLDELTPAQLASLRRAQAQHHTGQTIYHDDMKVRISQWLNR
jgi:hypothetical protein